MNNLIAIIPAAGIGKRLEQGINKAFVQIAGVPILVHCLKMLEGTSMIKKVVIAVAPGEVEDARRMLGKFQKEYFPSMLFTVVAGGNERQDSVANALAVISENEGYIAVHDAARPFAGKEVFLRVMETAEKHSAAVAAVPVKDTIKMVGEAGEILVTPDRGLLHAVQTPQIFEIGLLKKAYTYLREHPAKVTDDASVVELLGKKVVIAMGRYENIKITTPEDLVFAEFFLAGKEDIMKTDNLNMPQFRTGIGFDVHKLEQSRRLVLCGIEVPYEKGLLGHSDADVSLHALMDALLGGAALGDIGRYFPDTDEHFKGADSAELTKQVAGMLQAEGWHINNIDITIIAEQPKLAGYIAAMRNSVAQMLKISTDCVSIKATTTEKLGFTGRGEGIAATAVASLMK